MARVSGQMGDPGMQGMGMGSGRRARDKEPLALKKDLGYIGCDVCEIVTTEIYTQVEKQRSQAPKEIVAVRPGAKKQERSTYSESDVNAVVSDICNRRREAGEWLWFIDLVETRERGLIWRGDPWKDLSKKEKSVKGGNYLLVQRRDPEGPIRKWDEESATVRKSCMELFDEDIDDLDELIVPLWRGQFDHEAAARNFVCKEMTNRCSKKRKPLATERKDFRYQEEARNLMETERMMQNMEDQGMPMVMQSRDDMMEELIEGLMDEGMSEEEAKEFIEATSAAQQQGGGSPDDFAPDFMQPGLDEF